MMQHGLGCGEAESRGCEVAGHKGCNTIDSTYKTQAQSQYSDGKICFMSSRAQVKVLPILR